MAIDYFLILRGQRDADALRSGLLAQGMRAEGRILFGTYLSAALAAEPGQDPAILFRIDKFAEPDDVDREMFAHVAALLQRFSGDAVLSFELETTVLARVAGSLHRGQSDDVWTEDSWRLAQDAFAARGMPFHPQPTDIEPRR